MARYLRITMGVEVEVEDETTDDEAAATVEVVRALIATTVKDAYVEVDDWDLSKAQQPSISEQPYVQQGKRKPKP